MAMQKHLVNAHSGMTQQAYKLMCWRSARCTWAATCGYAHPWQHRHELRDD